MIKKQLKTADASSLPVISLLFCRRSSGSMVYVFTMAWVQFPAGYQLIFFSKAYINLGIILSSLPGQGSCKSGGIVKPTSRTNLLFPVQPSLL